MTGYRDLQAALANPPTAYVSDEACQGCGSDLDTAYRVSRSEMYRVNDVAHSRVVTVVLGQCCVEPIERCDVCQMFRCRCPEER